MNNKPSKSNPAAEMLTSFNDLAQSLQKESEHK